MGDYPPTNYPLGKGVDSTASDVSKPFSGISFKLGCVWGLYEI